MGWVYAFGYQLHIYIFMLPPLPFCQPNYDGFPEGGTMKQELTSFISEFCHLSVFPVIMAVSPIKTS